MRMRFQKGVSVIELLIALALGLVVVLGITRVFEAGFRANTEAVAYANLNQQMRAVMSIITRELKRAGRNGDALVDLYSGGQNNPFVNVAVVDEDADGTNECLVFGYDEDADGVVDANEWKSFAFADTGVTMDQGSAFSAASCDLDGTSVGQLVDTDAVTITNLGFTLTQLPSPTCSAALVGETILQATVRNVDVALNGQLANDASIARQMNQRVRVRADRVTQCTCQADGTCT